MGQGVTGRPHAGDQHVPAVVRQCHRPLDVQWIPAGQQAVNFETPRHEQDIGQNIRLDLRNIDRLSLLVNAAPHAIVADAMAGTRAQGVVDGDQRQGAQIVALALDVVHLGDFLLQGAASDRHAQGIDFVSAVLLVAHAFRA